MVRNQIDLHRQQAITLKQLSKNFGLSEAESIRQAGCAAAPFVPGVDAWEEAHAFMLEHRSSNPPRATEVAATLAKSASAD